MARKKTTEEMTMAEGAAVALFCGAMAIYGGFYAVRVGGRDGFLLGIITVLLAGGIISDAWTRRRQWRAGVRGVKLATCSRCGSAWRSGARHCYRCGDSK